MYAYSSVVLSELHLIPGSTSLTASRRAAERSAQLQAVRGPQQPSAPVRVPVARRLLAAVRPERTPA